MADPNTQIDWWIAQAWQEAQAGADNDALVAWLYENGLTAISSYTILQAALNCPPEEARRLVFDHPVWASEDSAQDLSDIEYTSETLEPEPEPDPTFELDEWAEEMEEQGPVYGEEGYRVAPGAGASPPDRPDAEANGFEGYRDVDLQPEGGTGEEELAWEAPAESPEFSGGGQVADDESISPPGGEPETEQAAEIGSGYGHETADRQDGDALLADARMSAPYDDDEPAPEEVSQAPVQAPAPAEIASFADLLDDRQSGGPLAEAQAGDADLDPYEAREIADSITEPATPMPVPTASPPTRKPPSTPAERAAVFAAAFGKKPAAAPVQAATEFSASASPNKAPPPTDSGPAAYAEIAPARTSQAHPQPTPAAAAPPLPVFDPLPPIRIDDAPAPADPLFGSAHRMPALSEPLFAGDEPADAAGGGIALPENDLVFEEHAEPATGDATYAEGDDGESELPDGTESAAYHTEPEPLHEPEDVREPGAEQAFAEQGEEPAAPDAPANETGEDESDSLPDAAEEVGSVETLDESAPEATADDPPYAIDEFSIDEETDLAEGGSEQVADEPAVADPAAPPAQAEDMAVSAEQQEALREPAAGNDSAAARATEARLDTLMEAKDEPEDGEEAAEPTARPRKRILLDPDEDRRQARMRRAEPQVASQAEAEDMANAARRLGIDFRMGDPRDAGIDPQMTQAARELGVTFRDDPTLSAEEMEEMELAAQKLGISFRDPVLDSGKPQKPLFVRYIPLLLGVIIIFFLLLAAAPFAGQIGSWF